MSIWMIGGVVFILFVTGVGMRAMKDECDDLRWQLERAKTAVREMEEEIKEIQLRGGESWDVLNKTRSAIERGVKRIKVLMDGDWRVCMPK